MKDNHSGVATLSNDNPLVQQSSNVGQVETINASDLNQCIDHKGLPILVKIDVEGFELVVIQQLVNCNFISDIHEIFYEIHDNWVDASAIEKELRSAGFSSFHKVGKKSGHYDVLARRA